MRRRTSSSQEVHLFETVAIPRFRAHFARLIVDDLPPDVRTVLNLGCATGHLAERTLKRLGPSGRVIAVDPDEGLINMARRRSFQADGTRVFFKVEPIDALSFGDDVFDAVVANLLFERDVKPLQTLAEAHRVLAPGGTLILSSTLRGTFVEVLDMFRELAVKHDDEGLAERTLRAAQRDPTPEALCEWVERAGFDDVRLREESFRLSFRNAGEAFLDPLIGMVALPHWERVAQGPARLEAAQRSLDIYHGGAPLSLTVQAGALTARASTASTSSER